MGKIKSKLNRIMGVVSLVGTATLGGTLGGLGLSGLEQAVVGTKVNAQSASPIVSSKYNPNTAQLTPVDLSQLLQLRDDEYLHHIAGYGGGNGIPDTLIASVYRDDSSGSLFNLPPSTELF